MNRHNPLDFELRWTSLLASGPRKVIRLQFSPRRKPLAPKRSVYPDARWGRRSRGKRNEMEDEELKPPLQPPVELVPPSLPSLEPPAYAANMMERIGRLEDLGMCMAPRKEQEYRQRTLGLARLLRVRG
jgi:hypothetical protein